MNKYKEAIKVVDTVLHHMCGEEKKDIQKQCEELGWI